MHKYETLFQLFDNDVITTQCTLHCKLTKKNVKIPHILCRQAL